MEIDFQFNIKRMNIKYLYNISNIELGKGSFGKVMEAT